MKLAQAYEANREQQIDQGIMKIEVGRGRIKKLAREQGLAQGKDSEAQSSIIGLKRHGSQIFLEREEKVARKKKCDSFVGNSIDEDISAATAAQRCREP